MGVFLPLPGLLGLVQRPRRNGCASNQRAVSEFGSSDAAPPRTTPGAPKIVPVGRCHPLHSQSGSMTGLAGRVGGQRCIMRRSPGHARRAVGYGRCWLATLPYARLIHFAYAPTPPNTGPKATGPIELQPPLVHTPAALHFPRLVRACLKGESQSTRGMIDRPYACMHARWTNDVRTQRKKGTPSDPQPPTSN